MYSEIEVPRSKKGGVPICPKCGVRMCWSGFQNTKMKQVDYYVCQECLLKRGIRAKPYPAKTVVNVVMESVNDRAKKTVEEILKRGNDVEIRSKKDGIQIIEVSRKTKYST